MLRLRRDIAGVLTSLYIKALGQKPDEAKRNADAALTTITVTVFAGNEERLRAELLALRRDVAVVMAKLFLAAGRSGQEVETIIFSPLDFRTAEQTDDDEPE